jgi:DNA polymerase-1
MVATWFYGPDYSKTQRVIAKAFVFGVMYGRGARSIAFGFGIPLEEAYEKMNILFSQMPRLRSWANHELRRDILTKGYVSTPLGRRRRFAMATADNYGAIRRFVVNSPIQGTASDILMLAMRNIQRWAPDYGAKLLFPLHDAVNLEVPEEHLHEVAMRTVWEMWQAPQQVFGPDCIPFKVDIDYGVSLQEDVRDPATGELTIQGDLHKLQYTTDEVNEVIERVAPQYS